MSLQNAYPREVAVLQRLFGDAALTEKVWARLNKIHEDSERFWRAQLDSIPADGVRYLLIAEAPPWSEAGNVEYIYNPESRSRHFLRAVLKALGLGAETGSADQADVLSSVAGKGFLLCDSLPFAMDYSIGRRRGRSAYKSLVAMAADSYLSRKMSNSRIVWHKDLRIAFSVRRNALPLIEHLAGRLRVGKYVCPITQDMVAVNGANYPCAERLANVFGLGPLT